MKARIEAAISLALDRLVLAKQLVPLGETESQRHLRQEALLGFAELQRRYQAGSQPAPETCRQPLEVRPSLAGLPGLPCLLRLEDSPLSSEGLRLS